MVSSCSIEMKSRSGQYGDVYSVEWQKHDKRTDAIRCKQ